MLITFLSAPSVTASTTQGWQVSIGDQQSISVNANNIGTALLQGEFRMGTLLDSSGSLSPQSVCIGFPEVQATRDIDDNDDYSLELQLDMDTCQIVVDDVRRTDLPDVLASAASETHEEHWGRAVVKAEDLPFVGGFDLTESIVMIDYASSLNVYGYLRECEVFSPAIFLGVEWHIDACDGMPITNHGNYLKTKTTGDFHATLSGDVWDESIHTSSAEIKGYSTRYIITCEWSPPSIRDLKWGILSVELLCKTDRGVIRASDNYQTVYVHTTERIQSGV